MATARWGLPRAARLQYAVLVKLIAIVEDEPAIRDNYAAAFIREGYRRATYGNRQLAMTACAARLPDLAVIDISLEDEPEGGFELCARCAPCPQNCRSSFSPHVTVSSMQCQVCA